MQRILILAFLLSALSAGQENHDHPAPEKLGTVSFPTSCQPGVQQEFNRAVALLHSFAYRPAEEAFHSVAAKDPHCAIAHWGVAMTNFHQLWEPPLPAEGISVAQNEIRQAEMLNAATKRERDFIHALSLIFNDPAVPYRTRALNYEIAMHDLSAANPTDAEVQIFYALALISNRQDPFQAEASRRSA
jgi:hypothetical protein